MIDDLRPQCTAIRVCFNDYDETPEWARKHGVLEEVDIEWDVGDSGKYIDHTEAPAYHLTVDDDLFYPADYVQQTLDLIEKYDRTAFVSWHGKILDTERPDDWPSYFVDAIKYSYRCLGDVREDVQIHVPGSGVSGYHTDTCRLAFEDFPSPNMADIHLGIALKRMEVPIICGAHEQGWIRHQPIDFNRTIYAASRPKGKDKEHAIRLSAERPWPKLTGITWDA